LFFFAVMNINGGIPFGLTCPFSVINCAAQRLALRSSRLRD
jgi:hypothetical protein